MTVDDEAGGSWEEGQKKANKRREKNHHSSSFIFNFYHFSSVPPLKTRENRRIKQAMREPARDCK
jgi:hypothetical protein